MSKKNTSEAQIETALKSVDAPSPAHQAMPTDVLSAQDKTELEDAKTKQNLAKEKMQFCVLQVQNADLAYDNIILRLAMRYGLIDGDIIGENGTITRKAR